MLERELLASVHKEPKDYLWGPVMGRAKARTGELDRQQLRAVVLSEGSTTHSPSVRDAWRMFLVVKTREPGRWLLLASSKAMPGMWPVIPQQTPLSPQQGIIEANC